MMDYLDKLREKPQYVRRAIALMSTSLIFSVIVSAWFFSFQSPLRKDSVPLSSVSSPLDVVANAFSGVKDNTKSMVESIQKEIIAQSSTTTMSTSTGSDPSPSLMFASATDPTISARAEVSSSEATSQTMSQIELLATSSNPSL